MNVYPMSDLVLIEPIKPEETTSGGLVIPANARQHQSEGVVCALGPQCKELAVGDIVLYQTHDETIEEVDDKILLAESHILAVTGSMSHGSSSDSDN